MKLNSETMLKIYFFGEFPEFHKDFHLMNKEEQKQKAKQYRELLKKIEELNDKR